MPTVNVAFRRLGRAPAKSGLLERGSGSADRGTDGSGRRTCDEAHFPPGQFFPDFTGQCPAEYLSRQEENIPLKMLSAETLQRGGGMSVE